MVAAAVVVVSADADVVAPFVVVAAVDSAVGVEVEALVVPRGGDVVVSAVAEVVDAVVREALAEEAAVEEGLVAEDGVEVVSAEEDDDDVDDDTPGFSHASIPPPPLFFYIITLHTWFMRYWKSAFRIGFILLALPY